MSRTMTRTLADALDSVDDRARSRLIASLSAVVDGKGALSRLLAGLRAELLAADNRDMATLAGLEADHRADLDDLERRVFGERPQRTEGSAWWPEGH